MQQIYIQAFSFHANLCILQVHMSKKCPLGKVKQYRFLSLLFSLILLGNVMGIAQSQIPAEHLKIRSGEYIVSNFSGRSEMPFQILVAPDTSIGHASLNADGQNQLEFRFDTEEDASGLTEVVVTYFQNAQPPYPVSRKYLIEVSPSCVKAENDYFSVHANSSANILDVLSNDDSDSTALHLEQVVAINMGTAQISPDRQYFEFTPEPDYVGQAYMTYLACNDIGKCDVGEIAIQVREEGANLGQEEIYVRTVTGKEIHLTLPGPDYILDQAPQHGSLQGEDGDIMWKYTSDTGFVGMDTVLFEYSPQVSRKFIIDVKSMDKNYHALNDLVYTRPNVEATLDVYANDLMEYPVSDWTEPGNGVVTYLGDGVFHYVPDFNYTGIDQFTYTTCYADSVYCESATVAIHVGNMEPRSDFIYRFRTLRNTKLPIVYKIPFEDYINTFSLSPANGDLALYTGYNSWQVECDTIEGYNVFVYIPDEGFTGTDNFSFYHCDPNTNLCAYVQVEVEVIDEEMDCPCVGRDCIWAGDANNDGAVDMEDLLTIGWYLGDHGPSRDTMPFDDWYGETGEDWLLEQPFTGENIKHADSDGDGVIAFSDTTSIADHYFGKNAIVPVEYNVKAPYQFSLVPVSFSLDSGDLVVLDVLIGTENKPAENIHGVKFSLNIPPLLMDSSTLNVKFHHDGWIGENTSSLSMDAVPYDGRVDAAITRARGNVVSGFGLIATISFIVEDDIEGIRSSADKIPFKFRLDEGLAYSGTGERIDIPGDSLIYILDLSNPAMNQDLDKSVLLFPNPANQVLHVHLNGKNEMKELEVFSFTGQQVAVYNNLEGKQTTIDLPGLASGFYIARISTDKGVISRKFEIIQN